MAMPLKLAGWVRKSKAPILTDEDREDRRRRKREYDAVWREQNRERLRAYQLAWLAAHPGYTHPRKGQWRKENKDRIRAVERARELRAYGLSPEQYKAMNEAQEGRCAICREPAPVGKSLHVDHCHKTSRVRGLLCGSCNLLLGNARDSPNILRAAIGYLSEGA